MDLDLSFPAQLSQHLRSLRKAQGWTQAQLAARLGVAQSRISAVEKDATSLTSEQLFRWLATLNARLVLRTDTPSSSTVTEPTAASYDKPPTGGQW